MSKKICVITGTRAEYGILFQTLKKLKRDKSINLKLIVTGSHLEKRYGLTFREIINDKFKIDKKIRILSSSDTNLSIAKSSAKAVQKLSEALFSLKPEIVLLVGDRYEMFSAAMACTLLRIPIAHIHGGESTEGLIDEPIRHSITKMSHLHFATTDKYCQRIIQLGENPNNVFNVGAPAIENILQNKFIDKKKLEKMLKFKFKKFNILVTFHPITLENKSSENHFKNILNALKNIEDTAIIFTKSNADPDNFIINKLIDSFVYKNENAACYDSLGAIKYYSCLKNVDLVLGNSSSGIIEVPSFKIPTINIGDRQKGRLKPKSVFDCDSNTREIRRMILKFKNKKYNFSQINPYYKKNSSQSILKVLKSVNLDHILKKSFFDLK